MRTDSGMAQSSRRQWGFVAVVAAGVLATSSDVLAQRMGLPGPRPGFGSMQPSPLGRTGTLLGRPGSLLPPPPPAPAPAPSPRGSGAYSGRSGFEPIGPRGRDFDGHFNHRGLGGLHGDGVRGVVSTSGAHIDGVFTGDRGRLAFHVGSPVLQPDGRLKRVVPFRHFRNYHPGWGWTGWYWPYGYAYNYWDYENPYVLGTGGVYADPYVSTGNVPQPQQPAPPPPVLTTLEKAQGSLQQGDAKAAVRHFREHLNAKPDDTSAMRLLAVAYLDDKQFAQAAAMMAMAYEKEPTLARTPMDREVLSRSGQSDADGLRQRVLSAVPYANRVDTASAWVLVATLMQAEGREDVARANIAKAKAKGLSLRVSGEFDAALGK